MSFDFGFAWAILPQLLRATVTTVEISFAGFAISLALGLAVAGLRLSRSRLVRLLALGYVEFIRLTPLLVQLFFAFYVLPQYGILLSAKLTGICVIGINYSAYTSEVYRAGITAVPRGQWEAAMSLSVPRLKTWRVIILPQAITPMLPAMCNYLISMFKDVPLLSTITVMELLATANRIGTDHFRYLEPLTLVGLIFFTLSYPAGALVRRLEAKVERA